MNSKELERLVAGGNAIVTQLRARRENVKEAMMEDQDARVSNPAVAKRADDEISMRRQLRSWFDFLDKDGSGEIDIHELEDPLTCMGLTHSKEEVERLISSIDENGNGEIGFDEFLKMVTTSTSDEYQPMKALFALFEEGTIGDASISLHVIIAAYRRFTVLRGLTSYARNKKGPDDMRAVKSLNALAVMQARVDAEEKEKLRSRLEAAYKQRLAARVDGEGGSVGSAAGRPRAGSNVSKYMFRESSAAQVVDPSAISEKERRAVRSAVSRLVEEARRSETSHLLTSTRAADYDAFRARASHKAAAEVISSGRPTRVFAAGSRLPAVAARGTDPALDRAMNRSAQLAVAAAADPLNSALGVSVMVDHDEEVRGIMDALRTSCASPPPRRARGGGGGGGARSRTGPLEPLDASRRDEDPGRDDAGAAAVRGGGVSPDRRRRDDGAGAMASSSRLPLSSPLARSGSPSSGSHGGVSMRRTGPLGPGSHPAPGARTVLPARMVLSAAQEEQQLEHFKMLRLHVQPADVIAREKDAPGWKKAAVGKAFGNWGYVPAS